VTLTWYLDLLLLGWLWIHSLRLWPTLPDRVPGHVGLRGEIRWDESTILAWLLLPIVATLSTAAIWIATRYSVRNPRSINIPGKDRLLSLPPNAQRRVLDRIGGSLGVAALSATMTLLLCQEMRYRAALGEAVTPWIVMILAVAVASGPTILITIVLTAQRALDAETRTTRAGSTGQP